MSTTYPDTLLFIDGRWRAGADGRSIPVTDPATSEVIGQLARAETADLDEALAAADRGFATWRATGVFERYRIMRRAADLLRDRAEAIAPLMTREQGKPLAEARGETLAAADVIDWFAEEGRRASGQIIPARAPNVTQMTLKLPVGPVAAFTPWNFPINQIDPAAQYRRAAEPEQLPAARHQRTFLGQGRHA